MGYLGVALVCALAALYLHNSVALRLRGTGRPARRVVGPVNAWRLHRDFLFEAPAQGWSPWPVFLLWTLLVVSIAAFALWLLTSIWLH